MNATEASRWFLAIFFVVVAAFYTVTIVVKKRRIGHSPVFRGAPGTRHRLVHDTFKVFRAAILLVCVGRLAYPALDAWLVPLTPLWQPWVLIAGDLALVASFASIVAMHSAMGPQWRSGVEPNGPQHLATEGVYGRSRNPMFLLVILGQAGLFLALPTVFTLVCLLVGVGAIVAQVRIEEHHLQACFGETYRDYAARTPRWLRLPRWLRP
jgi:protein-S-isoprenylcysteine O-methyltransferase Ste14